MKIFHAHVYFEEDCLEKARAWAWRASKSGLFSLVKDYERPVGPHPRAMIEAHFDESSFADSVAWIEQTHGPFSVLIHQDTGDDFKDHTDGIRWLGEELKLDFDFFRLILEHPELRIHQPNP